MWMLRVQNEKKGKKKLSVRVMIVKLDQEKRYLIIFSRGTNFVCSFL